MTQDIKARVEDALRFDSEYMSQVIAGGYLSLRTKEQRQDALQYVVGNMQSVIKELTEREEKLVLAIKKTLQDNPHLSGVTPTNTLFAIVNVLKELEMEK